MSTNFWELLQQHQNDLTKSGHMVADYLVQHAAEAQYLSISSLARECKVAEATVFRFCRALGFEGYHEMRIALAQANATGVLVNQQAPSPDADTTTLCEHASALFMTAINGTQNALSPEAVDQAVALLRQADALRQRYPGFDLPALCRDKRFTALLGAGMDMEQAYLSLHQQEMLRSAVAHTAQVVSQKVSAELAAQQKRPREGAMQAGSTAVHRSNPADLSRAQREAIARRVLKGEKIIL